MDLVGNFIVWIDWFIERCYFYFELVCVIGGIDVNIVIGVYRFDWVRGWWGDFGNGIDVYFCEFILLEVIIGYCCELGCGCSICLDS